MLKQPVPFDHLFENRDETLDDDQLAQEVGRPFGPMYGSGQGENRQIPAGFTYLGQIIDHDLSFDPTSSLSLPENAGRVQNFRTSALDLDSIYGSGPSATPHFYDSQDPRKFRLGRDREDLPRLGDIAVIADPRNDENVIVSQLLTAFLNFHNEVLDRTKGSFQEVQQLVRWHYQWIVLNEYLPAITGRTFDDIVHNSSTPFPEGKPPFTPFEFSLAAFRFGHSQIRGHYNINSNSLGKGLLILPDLSGRRALEPHEMVEWSFFFDVKDGVQPQPSLPIQPFISFPLLAMPRQSIPGPARDFELSLAYRDIRRGQVRNLSSGHDVASRLKLSADQIVQAGVIWEKVRERLRKSGSNYNPAGKSVPLWLYILFEAQEKASGLHLGPLAGKIVNDVIVGMLKADPESWLSSQPDWKPSLGVTKEKFSMSDLLRLAANQKTVH